MGKAEDVMMEYLSQPDIIADLFNGYVFLRRTDNSTAYDTLEYLKQAKQIEQKHKRKKDVSGKEFLSMFTKEDKLIPTITIVFYTGKENWDGAMDLDGLFENVEGMDLLLPYMVKAPLNVLHLYDVKNTYRYRSSLRKIFELMPFTEDGKALKQYVDNHENIYSHIDSAASRVLSVLLDLDMSMQDEEREGEHNVCEAIRQIKEEGKIEAYSEMGLSPEEIAQKMGISLEDVKKVLEQLSQTINK